MTLDEAIAHCEEVADYCDYRYGDAQMQCAADHRQLAEWLRELKRRREDDKTDVNNLMKPCPFCGNEAHIIERKPHETVLYYQVKCSTCSAGLAAGFARETDAIKAWNTRVKEEGDTNE